MNSLNKAGSFRNCSAPATTFPVERIGVWTRVPSVLMNRSMVSPVTGRRSKIPKRKEFLFTSFSMARSRIARNNGLARISPGVSQTRSCSLIMILSRDISKGSVFIICIYAGIRKSKVYPKKAVCQLLPRRAASSLGVAQTAAVNAGDRAQADHAEEQVQAFDVFYVPHFLEHPRHGPGHDQPQDCGNKKQHQNAIPE